MVAQRKIIVLGAKDRRFRSNAQVEVDYEPGVDEGIRIVYRIPDGEEITVTGPMTEIESLFACRLTDRANEIGIAHAQYLGDYTMHGCRGSRATQSQAATFNGIQGMLNQPKSYGWTNFTKI